MCYNFWNFSGSDLIPDQVLHSCTYRFPFKPTKSNLLHIYHPPQSSQPMQTKLRCLRRMQQEWRKADFPQLSSHLFLPTEQRAPAEAPWLSWAGQGFFCCDSLFFWGAGIFFTGHLWWVLGNSWFPTSACHFMCYCYFGHHPILYVIIGNSSRVWVNAVSFSFAGQEQITQVAYFYLLI